MVVTRRSRGPSTGNRDDTPADDWTHSQLGTFGASAAMTESVANEAGRQLPSQDRMMTDEELDQQIQELERRNDRKRKLERLAELKAGLHDDPEEESEPPARRRRARSGSPGRQKLTVPTIKFKGEKEDNGPDLDLFLGGLRVRFAMNHIRSDLDKILFATSCLEGKAHRRWMSYLTATKKELEDAKWEEMVSWLWNMSGDEDYRALDAQTALLNLRQGPNESFSAFLERFEVVEASDPEVHSDRANVLAVLVRLTPELRAECIRGSIPKTRGELETRARSYETVKREANKVGRPTWDPPKEQRGVGYRPPFVKKEQTETEEEPAKEPVAASPERGQSTKCPACGKEGHRRSNCPTIRCFKCNAFGHYANRCPQLDSAPATDSNGTPLGVREALNPQ
ncbi:hypothetical protein F5Y02DRAFT_131181 [Annulohypoxylon stygium]|nr:hypothetical protein F5Y02DRAFT_131181 [Annulohypoxylon stygium]